MLAQFKNNNIFLFKSISNDIFTYKALLLKLRIFIEAFKF